MERDSEERNIKKKSQKFKVMNHLLNLDIRLYILPTFIGICVVQYTLASLPPYARSQKK